MGKVLAECRRAHPGQGDVWRSSASIEFRLMPWRSPRACEAPSIETECDDEVVAEAPCPRSVSLSRPTVESRQSGQKGWHEGMYERDTAHGCNLLVEAGSA